MGACREPEVELRTDLGDEARARVGPHEHVGRLEIVVEDGLRLLGVQMRHAEGDASEQRELRHLRLQHLVRPLVRVRTRVRDRLRVRVKVRVRIRVLVRQAFP